MSAAVLVVDMVNGFLEPGRNLYCGDASREIIPRVRALVEREIAAGAAVFFICDTHDPDDLEFEMFPVHCVRGTSEAEVIPELADLAESEKATVIRKRRYSAFFDTDLERRLADAAPDKIIICGVCTDICVMHTASDARNRDYAVEAPADCVASFDQAAHDFALKHMKEILGVRLSAPSE